MDAGLEAIRALGDRSLCVRAVGLLTLPASD
jgi:hypothetical protein